jgi:hypothetical protein
MANASIEMTNTVAHRRVIVGGKQRSIVADHRIDRGAYRAAATSDVARHRRKMMHEGPGNAGMRRATRRALRGLRSRVGESVRVVGW